MLIFDYGGKNPGLDRGCWNVSIAAPNRRIADQHLATHLSALGHGYTQPFDNIFIRSRMFERNGIIYSDLEERVDYGEQVDG